MTESEIIKASKSGQLAGTTVNERLFLTGLVAEFDRSKSHDKKKARFILKCLHIDEASIDVIFK